MTWSKDSWNHHEDTRCRPGRETRERRGVGGANDCQRIADGEPRGSRFEGILSQECRIRGINVLWTIQVQTTSPLVAQAEFPGGCEFAFNREIGLFRVAVFEVFGQRQGERQNRKRESCRCPKTSNTATRDPKSTRLNCSHTSISYAVFCLKKQRSN